MIEVVFHAEAQDEYDHARVWYRARSLRAATRLEAEIDRVLGMVRSNPMSFPAYDDEHRFAVLRKFPYVLIFQVHPSFVYVVAVAQTARAPGYWQGRIRP